MKGFEDALRQLIDLKGVTGVQLSAEAGLTYKQDYPEGVFVTDFIIEHESKRTALECKFNVHRDFEKTGTIAELLMENLKIDSVMIIVPYGMNSVTEQSSGLTIVELLELAEFLSH